MQRNVTVVETKADSCLRGISIQFPRAGAKSQAGLGSCDPNGTVPSPHKELGVSRAGTTEEEPQGKDNIRSVSVPCSLLAEPLSLVAQDAQATTAPSMRWGEQVSAAQQLELPAEVCWGWGSCGRCAVPAAWGAQPVRSHARMSLSVLSTRALYFVIWRRIPFPELCLSSWR